jgi:metallo-beta-lactamase family protein
MRIAFLGAAREVTGSCFLVEAAGCKLLVDCGLFQGGADADRKNRARPAFDPQAIEFVLLTHAHIDHSGMLPRLASLGFRGRVFATPATCDLLEVMLPDAAFVQEREAQGKSGRHHPAPLYTVAQARAALDRLSRIDYDIDIEPRPGLRVRFRDAGHILGSAIVELSETQNGRRFKSVFSGDIGQPARPVVRDPTQIESADALVVESTYGDRLHKTLAATEDELVQVITKTLGQGGGNVVIPAFAVGRTQEILHVIADLAKAKRIRSGLDVYIDSPMATKATEVTLRHRKLIDDETRDLLAWARASGNGTLRLHFTESTEESKRLNAQRGAIIVSASGMCDAGRIRHHLKHNLPRMQSAIVFTGFQAAGTLGRRLIDGDKVVRLFGEEIAVRASIHTIGGLSAHADRAALLAWLRGFVKPPGRTFVVHGEATTALGFADAIRGELGWRVEVPGFGDTFDLAAPDGPGARSAASKA